MRQSHLRPITAFHAFCRAPPLDWSNLAAMRMRVATFKVATPLNKAFQDRAQDGPDRVDDPECELLGLHKGEKDRSKENEREGEGLAEPNLQGRSHHDLHTEIEETTDSVEMTGSGVYARQGRTAGIVWRAQGLLTRLAPMFAVDGTEGRTLK